MIQNNTESGLRYEVTGNGVACDYFWFADLEPNTGYVLHVSGENHSGISPKVIVKNLSNQKDLTELRTSPGKFSEFINILPTDTKNEGMRVSLEMHTFGNEKSVNVLQDVSFYEIPSDFLQNIRLEKVDTMAYSFEGVVSEQQGIGTGLFRMHVKNTQTEMMPVVLSQSYDPAWLAFSLRSEIQPGSLQYQLAQFFPWHFGTQLEHLKYNGWANAWLVPEGEHEVVMVYWPQLLSFVGYGLLMGTFVGFGVVGLKKRA